MNTTYLFFIDDTGKNNKNDYVLRGGFLISANEYISLTKEINNINSKFFCNTSTEVKWNDITTTIYLKENNKNFSEKKHWYYLRDFSTEYLKTYLDYIFQIISKYDIKIISNITFGKTIYDDNRLIEMELQNLMQKTQFDLTYTNDNAILIYDSDSKDVVGHLKEAYKKILQNDVFINNYSNIISNLFCEISTYSVGIQIADFIEGCIAGTLRGYDFSKKLYKQYVYGKLRKNTSNNETIGYGLLSTIASHKNVRKEIQTKLIDIINIQEGNYERNIRRI